MNLTFMERRRNRVESNAAIIAAEGNTLRVVEAGNEESGSRFLEPRLIRGGEQAAPVEISSGTVTARAEVKAKRFIGNRMHEDRYAATIAATDGSPHALLVALSRVFAEVEELRSSQGADERVILQVNLVL